MFFAIKRLINSCYFNNTNFDKLLQLACKLKIQYLDNSKYKACIVIYLPIISHDFYCSMLHLAFIV